MGYVEEKIKLMAVEAWQKNRTLHPLTCLADSDELAVEIRELDKAGKPIGTHPVDWCEAVLYCYNCDFEQRWVPRPVIDRFLNYGILRTT